MTNIYKKSQSIPRTARNNRIYPGEYAGGNAPVSNGTGINLDWVSVTPAKVTINRDTHIEGNLTASEEVVAWVAGAVTSDVLAGLTAAAPLRKSSASNLVLDYNTSQFEAPGGILQIKSGVLAPSAHSHLISDVTGLQAALDSKMVVHTHPYRPDSWVPSWTEVTGKPATFTPSAHSHLISDVTGLQTALNGKEALITKAAGFAKWTGSTWSFVNETYSLSTHNHSGVYEPLISAGTTAQYRRGDKTWQTLNTTAVAEGTKLYFNTSRVLATALTGYAAGTNTTLAAADTILAAFGKIQGQINARLTGNQTITLSGIVTGSGTTAITTAIADGVLSIAKTSGLQTALDGKSSTSHNHDAIYRPIGYVPAWSEITSKPIWESKMGWDAANSRVTISTDLHVTGNISATKDVIAYLAGEVSSDVLAVLTATAPLRKSSASNLVLDYNTSQFEAPGGILQIKAGVLAPSAHSHLISDVTGLQSALDSKMVVHTHPYRPDSWVPSWSDVTGKPATFEPAAHSHSYLPLAGGNISSNLTIQSNQVWHAGNDGGGSGLDADLLDGLDSSKYFKENGDLPFSNFDFHTGDIKIGTSFYVGGNGTGNSNYPFLYGEIVELGRRNNNYGHSSMLAFGSDNNSLLFNNCYKAGTGAGEGFGGWKTVWHSGNDGANSGLDSDLLDGQHGSYYATASSVTTISNAINASGLTNNYLPKWDGSKLNNSLIIDNGTQIGIGGAPTHLFTVIGTAVASSFVGGSGGYSAIKFTSTGATIVGSMTAYQSQVLIGSQNIGGTGTNAEIEISSTLIKLGYCLGNSTRNVLIGYNSDPTSGNKLAVNGAAYFNGNITAQIATLTGCNAQSFIIKDSGSNTRWTVSYNTSTYALEFKNASGVLECSIDQSGNLKAKGEVTAYATI